MFHSFRLDPFIYTSGPYNNQILFFNTLDSNSFTYKIGDEEVIILQNSILTINNNTSNKPYLITMLEERNMGVVIENDSKVFSLNMVERLTNSYNELENTYNPLANDNLLNHLFELTYCFKELYVNTINLDKVSCLYPTFSYKRDNEYINYQLIKDVLSPNNYQNLSAINYVGINYKDFESNIIPIYEETSYYPSNIIIPYNEYILESKSNTHLKYIIICDSRMINEFDYFINNVDRSEVEIHFYIGSEDEYSYISTKLNAFSNMKYKVFTYQKNNDDFLDTNIKYSVNEILEQRKNINQIIRAGIINELYYGKITIHNNGDVFSNIQKESLGNLKYDDFDTLLYKASIDKSSWRLTRENFDNCKECIFNKLCPPISEIEQYTSKVYCIK